MTTIKTSVLEEQWYRLSSLIEKIIGSGSSSAEERQNRDLAVKYLNLLSTIRPDRHVGGQVILGAFRAPASKDRHHDREGGLVQHLLEMWDLWCSLSPMLYSTFQCHHEQLNATNVLRAIVHHDLNKVWRYRLVPLKCSCGTAMKVPIDDAELAMMEACPVHAKESAWEVDYAKNTEDRLDALLGSVHKSLFFIQSHQIQLSPLLHNAIITSEGGFSALRNKYPDSDTVFAKIIYLLDEMSANVLDRLRHQRFWDSKRGGLLDEGRKET